jgi:hypothetical protein
MKLLITGVGGPTPRSFALSLLHHSRSIVCQCIGTDVNPLAIGLYQRDIFPHTYVIPPARQVEAYWAALEEIINRHQVDAAVILPELEVLAWSQRQEQGSLPCRALIPDRALAEALVDKARMTELLQPSGFVPNSVEFDRNETSLSHLFDQLGSEFWVRSSQGSSGLGSLKIRSVDELHSWIHINPGVERFLASSFLPGRNLAVKLLYFNGDLMRSALGERVHYIMAKVAPSGITGNSSFGRLLNEQGPVDIARNAMELLFSATSARKHGFFTVDLKEDEQGRPYITEINVRHVAFTQCFAAAGANFAEDTIRLIRGDTAFDRSYRQYTFAPGTVFLRDVDATPILMNQSDLLSVVQDA